MYRWIAIPAALALVIGTAYGQSSPSQPSLPLGQTHMMGSPAMHGSGMGMEPNMMPMMQMMQMHGVGMMDQDAMGPMGCRGGMGMMAVEGAPKSHLEARLAFVKSELEISEAQEPAWQAYAAALRAETGPASMHRHGMQQAMAVDLDFPARYDAHVKRLEAELSSLQAVRDEATALYRQLNAEQGRKADRLLAITLCR